MKKLPGLFFCFFHYLCSAQTEPGNTGHISAESIKLHYGTIVIHTPSVKNVAGARPYGAEVEFSRMDIDSSAYSSCNCFPRYGVALSYFNFDNTILGSGEMLSYFIEPSYPLSNTTRFNLRGNAGLVYASNPFDSVKNTDNKSYTTHVNPYLQVGIGITQVISQHLALAFMASFQHFSNGAYKEPNRGVNWLTGSLGLVYSQQKNTLSRYKKTRFTGWRNKKTNTDAGIFIVPGQGYNSKVMAKRVFLGGGFIEANRQYSKISALVAGTEIYYDHLNGAVASITKRSSIQAGFQFGHVFLFNKVTFSQQVGWQVLKANSSAENLYFRYGLSYRIAKHLIAGINLKAYADNADFADFRLGYRF